LIANLTSSLHALGKVVPTSIKKTRPCVLCDRSSLLLEAVPDDEIMQRADPDDADGNGISGRPNTVWSVDSGAFAVGKFGFKAGAPSLRQQVATAYAGDMGVTNPLFKERGRSVDIPARILDATTFYVSTLAVPRAREQSDPIVIRGKEIFSAFGCMDCHATGLRTGSAPIAALSNNLIHPFTDLLLHDMGEELADGRPEYRASGSEWRTAPLWGIGLADLVLSRAATYLHDGRARTLEEAILWHGGEASAARNSFIAANKSERDALIAFLRSL
jgi:CxxC motif-containing protein (DUF1111 family)